jgi:hypothetical protein
MAPSEMAAEAGSAVDETATRASGQKPRGQLMKIGHGAAMLRDLRNGRST